MKRIYLTYILTLMTVGVLSAQSVQPTIVSLDDCRQMAVENNAKVKLAKGSVASAKALKDEAFTKYFPTVTADGMAFWANKPVLYHDFDGLFSLGLIKRGFATGVYALQPVFAGGQIVNGNKLANVGVEASQLEQQNAEDKVRLTAEKYYWDIVTLKSKKNTLANVISMVDTLANQVNVAVKAGIILPNELLKVQIRRNELQTLMVDLDNGIDLSCKLLAQYIGMNGQPIDIAMEQVPDNMPQFPQDTYVDANAALPTTIDYQLLDRKVEAADLQSRMTAGSNLPTVAVGGAYMYDDLLNERYSYGALMVNVSIPISGWWGGSHAVKRSKIEAENARIEREDLSQMLVLNMHNTWDNLTAAYRKMQINHESIAQASENLRLNENYYHAGVSTITELLDAQTLYREAQNQYIESYGAFRMSLATYLDATGQQ